MRLIIIIAGYLLVLHLCWLCQRRWRKQQCHAPSSAGSCALDHHATISRSEEKGTVLPAARFGEPGKRCLFAQNISRRFPEEGGGFLPSLLMSAGGWKRSGSGRSMLQINGDALYQPAQARGNLLEGNQGDLFPGRHFHQLRTVRLFSRLGVGLLPLGVLPWHRMFSRRPSGSAEEEGYTTKDQRLLQRG